MALPLRVVPFLLDRKLQGKHNKEYGLRVEVTAMIFNLKNALAALSIFILLPYGFLSAGAEEVTALQEDIGSPDKTGSADTSSKAADEGKVPAADKNEGEKDERIPVDLSPLDDDDFGVGGICLMDTIAHSIDLKGQPDTMAKGPVMEEYKWKGLDIRQYSPFLLKYSGRTDLPSDFPSAIPGISEIYLTDGEEHTSRNIRIGSNRENVLRSYGRPDQVLWDEPKGIFYFNYGRDNKEIDFSIKEGKVNGIHVLYENDKSSGHVNHRSFEGRNPVTERDFYIAGYRTGDRFASRDSGNWEKKIANPKEEIWYYAGYAVRMTAKGQDISALLLTDNRMVTSRGITLGDDISTVEAVYGMPHRMEMDISGSSPKTTYIYFSPAKRRILMIGFLNGRVDGVISTWNPRQ